MLQVRTVSGPLAPSNGHPGIATSEVVRHTDRRRGDNVVAIAGERGDPEVRRLQHEAAILGPDVEAGADLIRDTGPEQAADTHLLLNQADRTRGAAIENRREE